MGKRGEAHIYFHFLIQAIVHDETVSHPDAVRLHGMSSDIGVISNIRVVEVSNLLLIHDSVHAQRIDRSK